MKKALLLAALIGCGEDDGGNEEEVITTVELTFSTATTEGTFTFHDPDGDGGTAPTADPITLTAGSTYAVSVRFLNRLEMPEEDITPEIKDEGTDHQVFFTGDAVMGPATQNASAPLVHAYADMDDNGLPIGLANTITTTAGTGHLVLTLKHLPPQNDAPRKDMNTAAKVAAEGLSAAGGTTDATSTFNVTVQ